MVKIYESLWDEDCAKFDANRANIKSLEERGFSVERYLVESRRKKLEKCRGVEINLGQDLPVDW